MRINGGLEAENDKLIQRWACSQRSYVSMKPAQCGHHYYSRRIRLLRWEIANIIPLTYQEHTALHAGNLKLEISKGREDFLSALAHKDYKNFLLECNLTDEDFVKIYNKKLKEQINEIR